MAEADLEHLIVLPKFWIIGCGAPNMLLYTEFGNTDVLRRLLP